MHAEVVLTSTENLMEYTGQVVKVIPRVGAIKIQFKLNAKKGCGRVVRKV